MPSLTYEALRRRAAQSLRAVNIKSADVDARLLLSHASGCDQAKLICRAKNVVTPRVQNVFQALLARRMRNEPIAYIIGIKEFWSLKFQVSDQVLIPRPETEGVVRQALNLISMAQCPKILDVGTGSGAILISLLCERSDALGVGLDISSGAIEIAATNAQALGVHNRCLFIKSDFLDNVHVNMDEKFDLLVSNPPYITDIAMDELPGTVANFEPRLALSGGADGLTAYRKIITKARTVLKPNASLVFEIGYDQAQGVRGILFHAGFMNIKVEQDLAGLARVISAKMS